jgi:hypothetical protein
MHVRMPGEGGVARGVLVLVSWRNLLLDLAAAE